MRARLPGVAVAVSDSRDRLTPPEGRLSLSGIHPIFPEEGGGTCASRLLAESGTRSGVVGNARPVWNAYGRLGLLIPIKRTRTTTSRPPAGASGPPPWARMPEADRLVRRLRRRNGSRRAARGPEGRYCGVDSARATHRSGLAYARPSRRAFLSSHSPFGPRLRSTFPAGVSLEPLHPSGGALLADCPAVTSAARPVGRAASLPATLHEATQRSGVCLS
jgi:hypothetical protein